MTYRHAFAGNEPKPKPEFKQDTAMEPLFSLAKAKLAIETKIDAVNHRFDRQARDPDAIQRVVGELDKVLEPFDNKIKRETLVRANRQVNLDETKLRQQRTHDKRMLGILERTSAWMGRPLVLERPVGSALHHLRQCLKDGTALTASGDDGIWPVGEAPEVDVFGAFEQLVTEAEVFLIEHNWAAAFAGADGIDQNEALELPYGDCIFEFRLSGRRVITTLCTDEKAEHQVAFILEIPEEKTWLIVNQMALNRAENRSDFEGLIVEQIRYACIAMDAQVAEHPVVRAEPGLIKARTKNGKIPPSDYHVVSLVRKTRAEPIASPEKTGKRRRLHFRRSHWRHYPTHKTRIPWCLAGDPDLGFVDKHYRL